MANSLVSLFYYLRWVVPVVQASPVRDLSPVTSPGSDPALRSAAPGPPPREAPVGGASHFLRDGPAAVAVTSAALSVLLGVGAGLLWPML